MACQYSFKSSAISGYELATWHYEKNKCDKLRIWKYEEEIHNYSIRDPPHVTKYSAVFLELKHWLYVVQKTDEIKKYLGIVRLVTQDLCVYIWLVMALFNIFQKCIAQIYRICTSQRKNAALTGGLYISSIHRELKGAHRTTLGPGDDTKHKWNSSIHYVKYKEKNNSTGWKEAWSQEQVETTELER